MGQEMVKEKPRFIGKSICDVNIYDIPKINSKEKEEFKEKYFSPIKIQENSAEFHYRLDYKCDIMFKRWDWLQNNIEIYVNMLRLRGFTDDQIQSCFDGKRPLCYIDSSKYEEFCEDLRILKKDLEKDSILKDVWFVQTGSSVTGFSNNPLKGHIDRPSKLTDNDSSDVDIVIVAENVKMLFDILKKQNIRIHKYTCVCDRKGLEDLRYGVHAADITKISEKLDDWFIKWNKLFKSGVQITFQDGNPVFPPWELPIPIYNNRRILCC